MPTQRSALFPHSDEILADVWGKSFFGHDFIIRIPGTNYKQFLLLTFVEGVRTITARGPVPPVRNIYH